MPPRPQSAPVGLLALLQNPQIMALMQWIQQARQMADQNMIGRNWTPPLGTAFGMAGMKGPAGGPPELNYLTIRPGDIGPAFRFPGTGNMPGPADALNAVMPPRGQSLAETGLQFPEATVQQHLATAPTIPRMAEPSAAVKAAEGMKGDAAEALINQLMGIKPTNYQNVPDPLMGFGKQGGQPFAASRYPFEQKVRVKFGGKRPDAFEDTVKGMNKNHALERAKRNWPDAESIEPLE